MELLKLTRKHQSRISNATYIALNIGLALAVLFAVFSFETPWVALVLTLISKWRIFAVRPRFWAANILANTVDVIVGVGHVILLYGASGSLAIQIGLTVAYIIWLLFIKPRSKRLFVALQAGIAVFYGVTSLAVVAYEVHLAVFILGMWLIGFVAARHYIMTYNESLVTVLSLIWGFVCAEIGWLSYHWLFAYTLPSQANIQLIQVAIIVTTLSFLASRVYNSHSRHGDVNIKDIIMPTLFSVALIVVLLLFFNQVGVGSLV